MRGKPIEVVKCETVDLEVPASAEIVLEGTVDIGEMKVEGPFGDHTGFYSLEDLYPVFHVQCITHRKNPIYATTIVGKPPQEDAWMALAVERIFLPAAKMMIPELVDFHLPPEGVAHNLMILSIRKSFPGQARKVMNAIWSLGQAMFTKCIVVVDEDCDVKDLREVTLRTLTTSIRSAIFSSRWGRWIRWTTHRGCRTSAARWGLTRRASGPPKASTGHGRMRLRCPPR